MSIGGDNVYTDGRGSTTSWNYILTPETILCFKRSTSSFCGLLECQWDEDSSTDY